METFAAKLDSVAQEWLSTAEAARYLGLTTHRIRAEFASGRLAGTRLGYRTLRFKRQHLDELMAALVVPADRDSEFVMQPVGGLVPHKRRGIPAKKAS